MPSCEPQAKWPQQRPEGGLAHSFLSCSLSFCGFPEPAGAHFSLGTGGWWPPSHANRAVLNNSYVVGNTHHRPVWVHKDRVQSLPMCTHNFHMIKDELTKTCFVSFTLNMLSENMKVLLYIILCVDVGFYCFNSCCFVWPTNNWLPKY